MSTYKSMNIAHRPMTTKQQHSCIATAEFLKKKKRITYKTIAESPFADDIPPTSVARRNERERNRVKMVNNGFATLRNHVPNGQKNKKMSKVETLRSAVEYIKQLQKLLNQTSSQSQFETSSISDYDCQQQSFDSYDAPVSVSTNADENAYSTNSMMEQMIYSPANSTAYPIMYIKNEAMPTAHYNVVSPSLASRTSPTPSMSSDITSHSESSPFHNLDTSTNNIHLQQQQHQQQHQTQSHQVMQQAPYGNTQPILLEHNSITSDDSELFDLVNWF